MSLASPALASESESHSVAPNSLRPHRYSPWNSPGQNTGVGSLSLLQGIFPTQGSNPGPSHCRPILYQLSHRGSPRILEWVAYPFSTDHPDPGIKPGSQHCRLILYRLSCAGRSTPSPTSPAQPTPGEGKRFRICLSSLRGGHANLCIVPILVRALPKEDS